MVGNKIELLLFGAVLRFALYLYVNLGVGANRLAFFWRESYILQGARIFRKALSGFDFVNR